MCYLYHYGFYLRNVFLIGLHRIDTPEILGEMVAMGGKQTKVGIKEIVNIFKENVPMRCYLVTGYYR